MAERQIFVGMQILAGDKWLADHAVIVANHVIEAIIPAEMIKHHLPATKHQFSSDHYLIPGLIDMHIHGANNKDVMDADMQSLKTIDEALLKEGVTSFLATTMTAPQAELEPVLQSVAAYRRENPRGGIVGVHLEGPFIAAEKMGAQNGDYAIAPDNNLLKAWQKLTNHSIKVVTLAPELPGAIELIKSLRSTEVIASLGHTNASYEQTCDAIAAGANQATHLFNAMSGIHQRQPGAVTALLLAQQVAVELIADGIHVHSAIVDLVYQTKSKQHILLVSDAMCAKCLGDGAYTLGGQQVNVKQGKATLADGTLAGSTLRLPDAIRNMQAFTGCDLIDAIQMATINPAQALGLTRTKGSIEVGKDADLVILSPDLTVAKTVRAGSVIK